MTFAAKERNLEEAIEAALCTSEGGYLECDDKHSLVYVDGPDADGQCSYQQVDGGYRTAPGRALDVTTLVNFVQTTQPKAWRRFCRIHSAAPEAAFADAFSDAVEALGLVQVLHHGFKTRGIAFKVVYFAPESGLNATAAELYSMNVCRCIRQFHYSAGEQAANTIDLVLDVNGIPLVGLELKDQFTGQTRADAEHQWRTARDPREAAFAFNRRMLAFFAVDLTTASVATRLEGASTGFLPFDQGSNGAGADGGAGNPANASGYATSYLWEQVLARESLLDILQKFVHVELGESRSPIGADARIIWPRFHQLDVVRKIVADVRAHGSGRSYLVQHSAGSGKSNSIAWTAYRLSALHGADDAPVFDSVVVVTDRRVIDAQLQATISGMDHMAGSIRTIGKDMHAADLRDALNEGVRLIVCTLQKFPVIFEEVESTGKRFAVIVDEAHSSQSGQSAAKLRAALADTDEPLREWAEIEAEAEDGAPDVEDALVREMAAHGPHENLTFCAFTATPKATTLEAFGTPQPDGGFAPFHTYSMRQAIQEGFILDPLAHYTTYHEAVEMARTVPENPELPTSPTLRLLRKYKELHPYVIAQKAEIAVETFRAVTSAAIGGRGKTMVVAASRLAAVRYFREMQRYAASKSYGDLQVMVAFSGTVADPDVPGVEYTEPGLNSEALGRHVGESQTRKEFHEHGHILVVAEKYQTGFDEPLLHTMIVDKKLRDVKAVQTLSRVNRTCPGKHDTLIVDFANEPEAIQEAFQRYYAGCELTRHVNCDLIYKTQAQLREFGVYGAHDVLAASRIVFGGDAKTQAAAQGRLEGVLAPAVARYTALDADARYEFRRLSRSFVKWYGYLAQIVRMFDADLHREYTFMRYLLPLLPAEAKETASIEGLVALNYYKLEQAFEGSLALAAEPTELDPKDPGAAPGGPDEHRDPLQELIDRINEAYPGDFTDEDRVVVRQLYERLSTDPEVAASAHEDGPLIFANSTFPGLFKRTLMDAFSENTEAFQSLFEDAAKYRAVMEALAQLLLSQLGDER